MILIDQTNHDDIARILKESGVRSIHATNGTYAMPQEKIIKTSWGGFEYIARTEAESSDAFVIAVNSDVSMEEIMADKTAALEERERLLVQERERQEIEGAEEDAILALDDKFDELENDKVALQSQIDTLEDQEKRAFKIAHPLQKAHPERTYVVMYYDEGTPTQLYEALSQSGDLKLKTLHKWGYGTDPDAPKIEGAEFFDRVYGFPLPGEEKPLCHDITAHKDQSKLVKVVLLDRLVANVPETISRLIPVNRI